MPRPHPSPIFSQEAADFSFLRPLKPTLLFTAFWRFAAERQRVFWRRAVGLPPWTTDPVLGVHKFTNAYRASDRVSQYVIRSVIYEGTQEPRELFFRTLLFKIVQPHRHMGDVTVRGRTAAHRELLRGPV